jgi:hypothetical protein
VREGRAGSTVYRAERIERDLWWLYAERGGEVETMIMAGVLPESWRLVEVLEGWIVR